ncbi:aquaporin [Adhaeribacter sp. BT258]|uniref:Aquaporin n=1 Tax=Adhaeribacter terrigena TaxID=2793070 RepID=A0ABS1C481_9BACT|nr:aquaporin [Adhaeribacter terrigena]MBK0404123.1 aquaporin [Adhaeribacter terrigena]
MKSYLAEFIGTFTLVFFAAGSALVDAQTNGAVSLIGCATASGLIVTAMIYTFGNVSGAHINPAVTIGFSMAGLFDKKEILPYVGSQLAGSLAAGLTLKLLFPASQNMGATFPAGEVMQSFILEIILTFLLMLVILHTSQGIKEIQQLAGFIIGGMVLLEIIFAGPISGGSMNPARSFGPALAAGNITTLWIYFLAPVLGAGLATFAWKITKAD